ncbi:MAG: universal stress protein [Thermodesulfobacteriota bacterium]
MKILAALDISDEAGTVLEKAVALAKQQGGELVLMSVAEDFRVYGDYLESVNVGEKLLAAAEKALKDAQSKAKSMGVDARIVAESAQSPADSIVDYAAANGVDLIVLGHRSKTGLERFLVGSVASKVVTHAPCSVMVVR